MIEIARPKYLDKLLKKKDKDTIKIVTGIRRCGKSYLLFELFYRQLLISGVKTDHVIKIALDSYEFEDLLDRKALGNYIKEHTDGEGKYYVLIDEVQKCEGFESVLNGLSRNKNLDIYVTGSNSKFLSSDIITEFRDRGEEIHMQPLSFDEFWGAYKEIHKENAQTDKAWTEYSVYGGIPRVLDCDTESEKREYLINLLEYTYEKDVVERNKIKDTAALDDIMKVIASATGSLTNPAKISNTFESVLGKTISDNTVREYIKDIKQAFIVSEAERYDVKGRKYIGGNKKYYYVDPGLRNALLNFRQIEPTHAMENIIFNELVGRGFSVDIGENTVYANDENGKRKKLKTEIDFVCNKDSRRYYVQSAYNFSDEQVMQREVRPLTQVDDSFKKIIVTGDKTPVWHTEDGIAVINIIDFLLNPNSLDEC